VDNNLLNSLKHYTLLFVENEKGIRENFKEFFDLLFDKVYIAIDGEDAFSQYKKNKPDLIITDIKMPRLDGIEFVKKIRKEDKKTAIVIISAHTETELLLQSVSLHLLQYIVKPLNEEKLLKIFQEFIELQTPKNFSYDKNKSEIIVDTTVHTLSLKENLFLDKIINQNRIISYDEIEFDIWDGKEMSQNALRLFIRNLRKKLPKNFIKNIPSQGYCKNC
jgi:DNA-binding response OmpR family regulator